MRVIIGGTQTLGTGVNIQERLACVHHVDVPMLPSDMEQRDGRILRQGNTIPEVEIFQYAVDKTLDSASYQMLARKKAFINDVMKGRLDGEAEEKSGDSVSYAEFSAQISGNKDAIRMVKVKADVERLRAMAGAHAQQVRGNRSKLAEEQRTMDTMKAVKGALTENMKTFEAFDPKKLTLPNGDVVERKDLIAWLDQYLEKHKGAFKLDLTISGIPVQLERFWSELDETVKLDYTITIPGLKSGYAKYGGEFKNGTGFMQSFAGNIGAKAEESKRLDKRMENQQELLKNLDESINTPFAEAKQLEALESEYMELASRLTSNESEKHFEEKPDLHDYLDADVDMSADVEFSEDEADGEQGDASKVKMSKPWTGEKEEYPAEWGKCFSQYRGKGYLAVQHLLHKKEGFVPAAFHREDIGDIDIVYGKTGDGVEDKHGYGLAHIRKRHPGMDWKVFGQVIQTGKLEDVNDHRVNIVDGKAKIIIELEWKGQERKWVVSAMGGDLTSTADRLLASNPREAAKQGIAPKGMITIGDLWEKSSREIRKFPENDGNVKLSKPAGDREIDLMRLERPASTQAEALEALKALSGVNIVNRETGIAAQINRTQRDKLVSNAALDKSKANGFSYEDHFHAVANIDRLFMNGSLVDDRVDRKGNPDVVSIKRFVAPAWLNGDFAEAYITVKETTGNKLYSLELDELKKPSDTKTGGTFKERYHIPEGYDTLLRKVEKAREFFSKNEKKAKLSKPSAKLSEMTDEAKGFVRSLFTNGGQSKPDVNPWAKTFGTIFHYARQVPSLERMFDAAANLAENKTKLLKRLFNGETGRDIPGELRALEAKQPEEYRKLNDYMLKQDRNRVGGFVHMNETDEMFVACDLEGNQKKTKKSMPYQESIMLCVILGALHRRKEYGKRRKISETDSPRRNTANGIYGTAESFSKQMGKRNRCPSAQN